MIKEGAIGSIDYEYTGRGKVEVFIVCLFYIYICNQQDGSMIVYNQKYVVPVV